MTINIHQPQLAAISIVISIDSFECHDPAVEQLLQPLRGAVAKRLLAGTAGIMSFRSINVCDADLHALEPNRVAIDHAVVPAANEAH